MHGDVEDDAAAADVGESPSAQVLREQDGVIDPGRVQGADPAVGSRQSLILVLLRLFGAVPGAPVDHAGRQLRRVQTSGLEVEVDR